jgi:two-component system LytT family response regulator
VKTKAISFEDENVDRSFSEKHSRTTAVIYLQGYRSKKAIQLKNVISVISEAGLSILTLVDGRQIHSSYHLAHFETLLPERHFFRVHKSAIINRQHIHSVEIGRTGTIRLSNAASLPLSARRKQKFINWFRL